jgi:Methionyl-tRNA formyltransferase
MERVCVLAASKAWYENSTARLTKLTEVTFLRATTPEEVTFEKMQEIKPEYIFIPHWSWIIPQDIWQNFECVIFHMTDLPFGRGGSPLQNLIARGIQETKISAIQCIQELDGGPIYLKKELSLHGSAEEIFLRCVPIVEEMICEILMKQLTPQTQIGEPVLFKRRTPLESRIPESHDLTGLYDHIRMLDAQGYPPAFLEIGNFRLEFTRASLRYGRIEANVEIQYIGDSDEV